MSDRKHLFLYYGLVSAALLVAVAASYVYSQGFIGPPSGPPEPPKPNEPPVAFAGEDVRVECAGAGRTEVMFDGSASSDGDGDPLDFLWSAEGITFDNPTSATPRAVFPVGATTVSLVVSDGKESSTPDTVEVVVEDTLEPHIAGEWVPLKEVKERKGEFILRFGASDACDAAPQLIGVLATPSPEGFAVEFKGKHDKDQEDEDEEEGAELERKFKVSFDKRKEKLKVHADNPENVLLQLKEFGGLLVGDGQFVKVHVKEDPKKHTFTLKKNQKFHLKSDRAVLKVVSFDRAGNSTLLEVSPF